MARNQDYCQTQETLGRFALVADDHCKWWTLTEAYAAACTKLGNLDDETSYNDFCDIARNLTETEASELAALVSEEVADGRDLDRFEGGEGSEVFEALREESIAVRVANILMTRAGLKPCFEISDDGTVTDGDVTWDEFDVSEAREAAENLIDQENNV